MKSLHAYLRDPDGWNQKSTRNSQSLALESQCISPVSCRVQFHLELHILIGGNVVHCQGALHPTGARGLRRCQWYSGHRALDG